MVVESETRQTSQKEASTGRKNSVSEKCAKETAQGHLPVASPEAPPATLLPGTVPPPLPSVLPNPWGPIFQNQQHFKEMHVF